MCSLHLTHPSGAVGSRHCSARGAVWGLVPCSKSTALPRVRLLESSCDCSWQAVTLFVRLAKRGRDWSVVIELRCKPGFLTVLVTAAIFNFTGIVTEATSLFIKGEMGSEMLDRNVPLKGVRTRSYISYIT